MYKLLFSFYLFSVLLVSEMAYADNLGRLFTDQAQRQQLDKLRLQKNVVKKVEEAVTIDIPDEPVVEEKEVIQLEGALRLRGLVYRSDGKNTAWINDSNSFEGDLESQYIGVSDNTISQDDVEIVMPDQQTRIKLKVGDAYVPESLSE